MYCKECGKELQNKNKFCAKCGTKALNGEKENKGISETIENGKEYIDETQDKTKVMFVECKKCNHIDKPYRWSTRTVFGVLLLVTILNVIGVLLFFMFSNPYICEKCGQRNKLVKILNNKKRIVIDCMSTRSFLIVWGIVIALGITLLYWRYSV